MRRLAALAVLTLTACAAVPRSVDAPQAPSSDWRMVATSTDRTRLREWRKAFTTALDQARSSGHGAAIEREGRLLEPDAATGPVPIPDGEYRCRVIKIGAQTPGLSDYISYPTFACRVQQQAAMQSFAKLGGSQRHVGLIFAADALRQVFLGTLVLGDEDRAMHYGRDPDRDLAGWVERVDERRWRMILPYPHFESTLDVIELAPAP